MLKSDKQSCCLSDCLSTRKVLGFKFPTRVNEGRLWLERLSDENLKTLTYQEIIRLKLRVCERHFADNCFNVDQTGFKGLKRGYYPISNKDVTTEILSTNPSGLLRNNSSMQSIHDSLVTFNKDSGRGCSIFSFFYKCFRERIK